MKILVPTDFSINAHKAFQYAAEIYGWDDPEIILVNIQNARHAGSVMSIDLNQDLMIAAKKQMEEELEVVTKAYPGLDIRGIVTAGTFTDSVLETVDEQGADLIIAGTKGATGAKEVLMGSNASALVDHATRPLIVVPEAWTVSMPSNVMLAGDFSASHDADMYDLMLDLCYEYSAKLDVFHVKTESSAHYTLKEVPFTVEGLTFELNEFESNNVENSILNHAHENQIDLIVMVKSKGNFIYNLFHRSVTKKLSMHTDVPLMILR